MTNSFKAFLHALAIIANLGIVVFFVFQVLGTYHGGNGHARTYSQNNLRSVARASRMYQLEYGLWPEELSDFASTNNPKRLHFLMEGDTRDGWNYELVYEPYDAEIGCGFVRSLGRDNRPGGRGYNMDLVYRFSLAEEEDITGMPTGR